MLGGLDVLHLPLSERDRVRIWRDIEELDL